MIMKQVFVNILYKMGDLISKSFIYKFEFGYDFYNYLMIKSLEYQDKWELKKPWKNIKK